MANNSSVNSSTNSSVKHPPGLYLLFATEMWERFSYYGMRAIFFLFMTKALLFSDEHASDIYGNYTGLVYLTPLLGGYLSDRYLGNRRSILIGGLMMALAQFLLFFSASFIDVTEAFRNGKIIYTAMSQPQSMPFFYAGLGFLILGNGFFKPNISSMVGQLYPENDRRLDAAFTIFYMGINLGAFIAPIVCGQMLGDTGNPADFKWGFFAAGVGMILSVITFSTLKNRFIITPTGEPIGMRPKFYVTKNTSTTTTTQAAQKPAKGEPLTRPEIDRIMVIGIISIFVIFFWAAFEQAGASLTLFAERNTDREIFGTTIASSLFQSVNPVAIVIFAPIVAWIWTKMGQRGIEPASPAKQAMGLMLLALGYLVIALGVKGVDANTKVSMGWLLSMYMVHTLGELAVSPIGLSMVVKLSPVWLTSFMMGIWFLSTAAANKFAGELSKLFPGKEVKEIIDVGGRVIGTSTESLESLRQTMPNAHKLGEVTEIVLQTKSFLGYQIHNLYDFFMLFVCMAGAASIILFLLTRKLNKMMHGRG